MDEIEKPQSDTDAATHMALYRSPSMIAWGQKEVIRVQRERIERLEAALDAIMSLENVDAASGMEGTRDFWDGVDTGLSACRDIARKAKEAKS
jgi:hypothetical protein